MSTDNGKDKEGTGSEAIAIPAFEISAVGRNPSVKMSFNPQTPEGAIRLVQATLEECDKLEDQRGKDLNLVHWMVHPAQTTDENTGEVKEFARIIVWDDKDKPYSCGSIGVDKSIAILEMTRGKAPWSPPLKVKVTVRRLANKNNWMTLVPDIDSLREVLKAKK